MNALKVKDMMTHLVVTLRPNDTLHEASRRMLRNRISGTPVVAEGKLVGVVSEADLVQAYMPPARIAREPATTDPLMFLLRGGPSRPAHNRRVADVMTEDVVSIPPEASVWEAASLIDRSGIKRLPVVDDQGYVVGVVARADLVKVMARDDVAIRDDVLAALDDLGAECSSGVAVEVRRGRAHWDRPTVSRHATSPCAWCRACRVSSRSMMGSTGNATTAT